MAGGFAESLVACQRAFDVADPLRIGLGIVIEARGPFLQPLASKTPALYSGDAGVARATKIHVGEPFDERDLFA